MIKRYIASCLIVVVHVGAVSGGAYKYCDDDEVNLMRKATFSEAEIASMCNGISNSCRNGGLLSGIGGDGKSYSAEWKGSGSLETIPYNYQNRPFLHFKLNGKSWPDSQWGVSAESWKLTCTNSHTNIKNSDIVCDNGGTLTGTGGDNQTYTEKWNGYGELVTIPYRYNGKPFFHFKLNGSPWPSESWGVSQATWKVRCN